MWTQTIFDAAVRDVEGAVLTSLTSGAEVSVAVVPESGPASARVSIRITGETETEQGEVFDCRVVLEGDAASGEWASLNSDAGDCLQRDRNDISGLPRLLLSIVAAVSQGPHELDWGGLPAKTRPPLWFSSANDCYRITGVVAGGINFALAHNRLPIVRELVIEGLSGAGGESLETSIAIESQLAAEPVRPATLVTVAPEPLQLVSPRIELPPVPKVMAGLEEAVAGDLLVDLLGSSTGRINIRHPIDILAYNQWSSLGGMYETLVAFVQPNSAAIVRVLQEAASLLQAWTGDPSLQGYQSGSGRAREIAAAIYEALCSMQIGYINPPASFEDAQKIRTPEQVLSDRLGTCLDTTVTYAACLEQAGLCPVLFLLEGHAFSGFLSQDGRLPNMAVSDVNTMVNLVESGVVVPVETTTMTAGVNSKAFDQAVAHATQDVTSTPYRLRSLVDVSFSRTIIRPLPSRGSMSGGDAVGGVGSSVGSGASGAPGTPPEPPAPPAPVASVLAPRPAALDERVTAGTRREDHSPPRVRSWKTSLLDLSMRNQLLNFKDRATNVGLILPNQGLHRFEDMIASGHKFTLTALDGLTRLHLERGIRTAQGLEAEELSDFLFDQRIAFAGVEGDVFPTRLRSLRRKARSLEEETGANHLFLTLGELKWTEDGKPAADTKRQVRSPLLLVPIRLEGGLKRTPKYRFHIEEGGFAVPNYSLLEKLRTSFGLEIPELMTPLEDEAGVDIDAVLAAVRTAAATAELPFSVDERGYLALLSFSAFRLWKDLDEYQSVFIEKPIVRHLVESPTQPFEDPKGDGPIAFEEEQLICPVEADGSQMQAVAWAAAGRSFVLEGPPGTGKSQTITNMIAQLMSEGKTVLFVAEKQPALEVVQRRLAKVGLGSLHQSAWEGPAAGAGSCGHQGSYEPSRSHE